MTRGDVTVHTRRARRRRVILALCLGAVGAGLLVYIFVFSRHGYLRRRELERENAQLNGELAALRRENAALRAELSRLDDPAAVEKLARDQLGLVRKGDTVYRFVETGTAAAKRPDP